MARLAGKVAIVTGCASGIGAATVRRLRADGAEVLGTDLDAVKGAALCAETGALFAVQDVSDRAAWPQIVARAVQTFGRLDILVNNAGMVSGAGIGDLDDDAMFAAWDKVLAVNLTGTMAGCRAAIAAMIFGVLMYASFIWIWMPLHYIHMMFITFFVCVSIALPINRFILGNRAEFIGLEKQGTAQEAQPAL